MRRKEFRFPVSTLAGSSLRNIMAIRSGHKIERKYLFKYTVTLIVSGIFEIFNAWERFRWNKKIRKFRPEKPPVFIIGFWRSGTTHLHNLLCQDPDSAYTTTFQTVFPNLFLTQKSWLKPLINFFLPARRPYDNVSMDVDFPQEEDFGLMNLQSDSIYKFFLFPKDFDKIIDETLFTEQLPPGRLKHWKRAYHSMIAKAVFNRGGTRYIGKNPCHLTRTKLLREMYPGAKFIFIHRHPCQVIESLYHFILSIFPGTQLQDVPLTFSRENVVRMYVKVMNAFFEDISGIPSSDLIMLKMEDFHTDVHGHLENIYRKFELGDYSKVRKHVEEFISRNPGRPHHADPPSPEIQALIEKYAGSMMIKLGYAGSIPLNV